MNSSADLRREYELRANRSPWLAYPLTCVPAILPWHESKSDYRSLFGANDIGKTVAGAWDLVTYAMGYNPIRDEHYPTPNVCWAVAVEYKSAGYAMFRKLSNMLPRKENGKRNWTYNKADHRIFLPNGSEIAIKSQKEGESSLLAERCLAIWVDEATGGDTGRENFGELQARGMENFPLKMMFTLTPKIDTDIGWMMRKLWRDPRRPNQEVHEEFIEGSFCHQVAMEDCLTTKGGYVRPEIYAKKLRETPEEERDARLFGRASPFSTRPAFSFKLLEQCMLRAPKQVPVRLHRHALSKPTVEEVERGPCRMQRQRESAHNYIAALDPSSGFGKGHDPMGFVVLDRADLALVFHARANDIGPDQFVREIAIPASQYYNDALLVVESNGQGGGSAVSAIKESEYINIYMQKTLLKAGANLTDRIGWNTNEQSRYRMIDALKRALEENKWTPCLDLIEEMTTMMKKAQPSGRYKVEHADGFHDDLAMAAGIALAVHYEEPVDEYPDFALLKPRWGPNRATIEMSFT